MVVEDRKNDNLEEICPMEEILESLVNNGSSPGVRDKVEMRDTMDVLVLRHFPTYRRNERTLNRYMAGLIAQLMVVITSCATSPT